MKIILDVETKADKRLLPIFNQNLTAPKTYKDPEKIQAWIEEKEKEAEQKMAVDPDYAEIFCIGVNEIGGVIKTMDLPDFCGYLNKLKDIRVEFITFNGKKFDLPLIIKSGLKQGLNFNYRELKAMCRRYQNYHHYDLMEIIGDGEFKSLDTYLQIYLDIKKKEIDFNTCTDDELREHCVEDLENTEKLYNLFKLIIL